MPFALFPNHGSPPECFSVEIFFCRHVGGRVGGGGGTKGKQRGGGNFFWGRDNWGPFSFGGGGPSKHKPGGGGAWGAPPLVSSQDKNIPFPAMEMGPGENKKKPCSSVKKGGGKAQRGGWWGGVVLPLAPTKGSPILFPGAPPTKPRKGTTSPWGATIRIFRIFFPTPEEKPTACFQESNRALTQLGRVSPPHVLVPGKQTNQRPGR